MKYNLTIIMLSLALSISMACATTIRVPSEQPTIQAGIDAAVDGDSVLVSSGLYTGAGNRDIDFSGKKITVCSEFGPGSTGIDCENSGRGFFFGSGEDSLSVLDGFTILNGTAADIGGGIFCASSSPTITNCTITGNTAIGEESLGGGIFCEESSPIITNCNLTGNSAAIGGPIFYGGSVATISNCTIAGNTAVEGGSGLTCFGSSLTLTNCTIAGNTCDGAGGGILSYESSIVLTNCTITENTVVDEGGGFYCEISDLVITNSTITGNMSSLEGGGIYSGNSNMVITNCILWNDSPGEIFIQPEDTLVVTYSDVQGGWEGEGNIDEDPQFAAPDEGDFSLTSNSPCIDAGDPSFDVPMGGGSRIDMGAYEYWYGWNIIPGLLNSKEKAQYKAAIQTGIDPRGLVSISHRTVIAR